MRNALYLTGGVVILLGIAGAVTAFGLGQDCRTGDLCQVVRDSRLDLAVASVVTGWAAGLFFMALGHITRLLEDIRDRADSLSIEEQEDDEPDMGRNQPPRQNEPTPTLGKRREPVIGQGRNRLSAAPTPSLRKPSGL